jgi:hypothetical protein
VCSSLVKSCLAEPTWSRPLPKRCFFLRPDHETNIASCCWCWPPPWHALAGRATTVPVLHPGTSRRFSAYPREQGPRPREALVDRDPSGANPIGGKNRQEAGSRSEEEWRKRSRGRAKSSVTESVPCDLLRARTLPARGPGDRCYAARRPTSRRVPRALATRSSKSRVGL